MFKSFIEKQAMKHTISDMFNEAKNEECEIIAKNVKDTGANLHISGSGLSILILLAAIEKNILSQIGCSEDEFEVIKDMTKYKVTEERTVKEKEEE